MSYANIYILGKGKVVKECQNIAQNFFKREIIDLNFLDTSYLDAFLSDLRTCLIISANNFHIFKKECIRKNTIINYHNSLLPHHKGLNAHIWVIWEGDEKTGISWHLVEEGLDLGPILIQRHISIDENLTSLELLNIQHKLAISSFKEALENLHKGMFKKQGHGGGYHTKKLPNDGFLELNWDRLRISRFLRAMDCGALNPMAKIKILGQHRQIVFYQINEFDLILHLDDDTIVKITKEENANH